MSIFTILDVISNAGNRNRLGGPNSLSGSSQYDNNTYRFPIDIGNYDKGHYILIHINEQTKTQFPGQTTNDLPTVHKNIGELMARRGATNLGASIQNVKDLAGTLMSSVNTQAATDLMKPVVSGISDTIGSTATNLISGAYEESKNSLNSIDGSFLRTIRRTTDTIALYMPDSLQFTYSQNYDTPHMSEGVVGGLGAVASSAIEGGKIDASQVGKNLSPFFLNYLSKLPFFGKSGSALFTAATGLVQNPMMEVLYTSPNLREFDFSFMFYPRSEKEALEVQKILQRLKFHQAPEIKANQGGFFLVPPSEFDIKFMYNGKENPNIDKISTCVLTSISVDYAKSGGFTAFEVAGENDPKLGRTGMPTGIALTLKFKETQILTKESYNPSDFNGDSSYGKYENMTADEINKQYGNNNPYENPI